MEQAEYRKENIQWESIPFEDNHDCLDTIQGVPFGILPMLDDESRLGRRGCDKNWFNKMTKQFMPNKNQKESENTRFSATPIQKSRFIFCVRHFAGVVKYESTTGFVEKNRDEISIAVLSLFETSSSWLIKKINRLQKDDTAEKCPRLKDKPLKSKSLSKKFKHQLDKLMSKIERTEPHYIRCLKPNDTKDPNLLMRKRLVEQLRCGGVLEAIRVARSGYPIRLNHDDFFQTYRLILPNVSKKMLPWNIEEEKTRSLCTRFLDILLKDNTQTYIQGKKSFDKVGLSKMEKICCMQMQPFPSIFSRTDVQLGKTKLFLKKTANDTLEARRAFYQTAFATIIQAWFRGIRQQKTYPILCNAIQTMQRIYRGYDGRAR